MDTSLWAVCITGVRLALNQEDNVRFIDSLPFFNKDQNMNNVLNRSVLVLNRLWQAVNSVTVQAAVSQMAAGAATALDIRGDDWLVPVTWEEWIKLPPLNEDEVIHTQHLNIRQPTVLILSSYDKIPSRRPKFTLKNIARRDGNRCQYSGKILTPDRMSMDHVLPLSRGGADAPENVVLADKEVNNRKGSKTPAEAGLPMPKIRKLTVARIEPKHPHHELFLKC